MEELRSLDPELDSRPALLNQILLRSHVFSTEQTFSETLFFANQLEMDTWMDENKVEKSFEKDTP